MTVTVLPLPLPPPLATAAERVAFAALATFTAEALREDARGVEEARVDVPAAVDRYGARAATEHAVAGIRDPTVAAATADTAAADGQDRVRIRAARRQSAGALDEHVAARHRPEHRCCRSSRCRHWHQ